MKGQAAYFVHHGKDHPVRGEGCNFLLERIENNMTSPVEKYSTAEFSEGNETIRHVLLTLRQTHPSLGVGALRKRGTSCNGFLRQQRNHADFMPDIRQPRQPAVQRMSYTAHDGTGFSGEEEKFHEERNEPASL
jgi:hypothetical protein